MKFKIEDWFAVKNPDKADLMNEQVYMAWVVIKYQANCKIADTPLKTMNEGDNIEMGSSSKKNFNEKVRELSKGLKDRNKAGFYHLENVEKQIRDRRRKTSNLQGTNTMSPTKEKPSDLLSKTLTAKKQVDLGVTGRSKSPTKIDHDRRITPDDLYAYTDNSGTPGMGQASGEVVNARMAKEYSALQAELKNLKARCTALEEGQMTVDNLQLAKQLEKEKADQNKDHLRKIKELQDEEQSLAAARAALQRERQQHEAQVAKDLAEIQRTKDQVAETERSLADRVLEVDKIEEAAQAKSLTLQKREAAVVAADSQLKEREERVAEYAAELDELKDRLMQERERAHEETSRRNKMKEDIDNALKDLEQKRKEFEKREKDHMKEMDRREREVLEKEEKLSRENKFLEERKSDFEEMKKTLDERSRKIAAQNEANERESIELLQGKNKLASDIRQWMADKKLMEKEIRDKREEAEAVSQRLKEEEEEAEQREEELDEREDELEEKFEEVRAREQTLLADEEAFAHAKRRFVENVMSSGGLDKLPPELKQMAENLGINVADLMEEEKKINERKNALEKMKAENEENMQKAKAAQEERRMSRRASQQMTNTLLQKFGGGPDKDKAQADLSEILKKRIMVKDPGNEDNIEYVGFG